ncbi:MAG: SgcJ/EcaC family oxidoreductase [Chitinophagaceae bacterium]
MRAVIQKMDDAWNIHDYYNSGQYDIYAPDATLVNPVGMYWKNRAEIIKAHQVLGETMFKYSSAKSQQVGLRFLAPTVALATVKAQYRFEQDYNSPDGKAYSKGNIDYAMINVVFTKQNGAWKIAFPAGIQLRL